MRKILVSISRIPRYVVVLAIKGYQATLSPDHGLFRSRYPHGFCRHYPSCSEYSKQAIERFGLIRGVMLGAARLARCAPWSVPVVDKIPEKFLGY